jgi:DNA polymerase Ligase (LigD)
MPRFVILRHDCPPDFPRPTHWDLMLQDGDSLRTWALPREPADGVSMSAEALAEHRLAYLEYDGPLTQNRGTVARFDGGFFHLEQDSDAEIVVRLEGARLVGRATLVRLAPAPEGGARQGRESQCWKFSFSAVRPATSGAGGDVS